MLGLSISAPLCFAQADEDQPQWYQVELLVFAYQQPNPQAQEAWSREPGLKYPKRIIELKHAAPTEILINTQDSNTLQPENTDVEITVPNHVSNEATGSLTTPTQPTPSSTPLDSTSTPMLVQLKEQPFTLLEPQQLSFNNIAKRLFRQNDIRPLFHGAWRQPIASREQAESILIRGGDQFDNHYELEGSITIGLERYLHISTDLWLSSFVSNVGSTDKLWPVLPRVPATSNAQTKLQPVDPFTNAATTSNYGQLLLGFENPFMDLIGNQYAVDQTVALRQQRRMRSSELHYIDHPLMGLLIRVTPYEAELAEKKPPTTTQ